MRKLPALLITAGLLTVGLTACAPSAGPGCESPVPSGSSSSIVEVTGDAGTAPRVEFPTPLKAEHTERTVVREGEGPGTVEGQQVVLDWSVYNGTSGELIEKSAYDGSSDLSFSLTEGQLMAGMQQGLLCATEGSQITLVIPPADAFGEAGSPQLGVAPEDSLVFVIDVNRAFLPKANGTPQAAVDGLPSVVLDADGVPGVTIPSADAPTGLEVAVLKQGDGATVQEGDQIVVHYTGVLWDTKTVFDSSWTRGAPARFAAAPGSATVQNGVIPGFAEALVGQQVGSQIIAVIPPELAYGEQGNGSVPPNATLVFVVDILGIV
ncbi:FKBP-type peptidyl-prolyl cis-trans isomerase [Microterricola viridarii]|uniref:peptidylprolyl isomerase n=1 Tax=Microterricola viridarii TaxID=412690 RepID=A0A1H1URC0_9MICO|nr:FKBP-type peptidyl-prolyl cis-trans isomerase [Microterricola viridarii]SDS74409.1 peptidylprolyl isomerase [Microterricola viridarii]